MQVTKEQIEREIAIKLLEKKSEKERDSLYEFVLRYWRDERKIELDRNRHLELICNKLEDVFYGRTKRLMINVPPRSLKTEIVSIAFPARCLGKRNNMKFMGISYATTLAQQNSMACRNMYLSQTYQYMFPRASDLKDDLNTKTHWETINGGQYYASGSSGSITGLGCDIMLIDDPLKPGDATSDVVRIGVNNNFHNTLKSRLNDKQEGAIVIIMQRLRDDDLCGHLIELEKTSGEQWEKLIIKAIAEDDDEYRKQGESFFEKRFPISELHKLKRSDPQTFSSQYQQEPTNRETQEFHEERFRYYDQYPSNLRIYTIVDPAFKQGQDNDNTSILTVGFVDDKCYILENTAGKRTADIMIDKIVYHIRKRNPEKVGIEAYQAQSMILTFLKPKLQSERLYTPIEEVTQTGDKSSKIRKLLPLYRNGLIHHPKQGVEELELELIKFPRGKHDDRIDTLQMAYSLYELQPNSTKYNYNLHMSRDQFGNPIIT